MRLESRQYAAASKTREVGRVAHVRPSASLPKTKPRPVTHMTPGARRSLVPVAVMSPDKAFKDSNPSNIPVYTNVEKGLTTRPRVIVLGSGWGAMSFIKALPSNVRDFYDIVVLSPRNYFLYTPLLPAVATGTMEERSIVEPVRKFLDGKGEYYEAMCKDIDPIKKELIACFPADAGMDEACFKMSYDVLVMSVGSVNNSFGIKGVEQYCFNFKSIEDANILRRRVTECFERAALPRCPAEDRKRLLSFVVAGGGPTGVEVAAELHDMIYEDLYKLYPNVIDDVSIQLIELADHVLSTYDRAISEYTAEQFKRAGIKLVLNTRVASVDEGLVTVVNKAGETTQIPFGACVWATGIAMHPLMKGLQSKLPNQTHFRSIFTDGFLRVNGSSGSIFALGDASTIEQPKAMDEVDELFDKADINKDGKLSMAELLKILQTASKEFSHLEEHARRLEIRMSPLSRVLPNGGDAKGPLNDLHAELSKEDFKELLASIDLGLRALPATAQVAQQQGRYLASLFTSGRITGDESTTMVPPATQPFKYFHKGSLAYVGQDKAVMDVPKLGPVFGRSAGFLWKGYETYAQFSWRNRCLVAIDWLRTKIFGRDISRV